MNSTHYAAELVLITNIDQLIQNIRTIEHYLTQGTSDEKAEAKRLIKDGICFVAYERNNEYHFAPSRFLGYVDSKLERPVPKIKHGAKTNKVISKILKPKPEESRSLEDRYLMYCHNLGIQPNSKGSFGEQRRFWPLDSRLIFSSNTELFKEI